MEIGCCWSCHTVRKLSSLLWDLARVAMQQWLIVMVTSCKVAHIWLSDYTTYRTCIRMHAQILVVEHTQTRTANFNCIQISVLCFHMELKNRCTVQSCQSRCVVYKRTSICNFVQKRTQHRVSNAAEIHCIVSHLCSNKCMEGKNVASMLCTQALPRLTFHCHTVEMGDKATHTHMHHR